MSETVSDVSVLLNIDVCLSAWKAVKLVKTKDLISMIYSPPLNDLC